jgi:hypothetical protein
MNWNFAAGCFKASHTFTDSELPSYGHTGIHVILCMIMERTALFLKEEQLKKLKALSEKTGAPVAELIRRAIDRYLQERAKELK